MSSQIFCIIPEKNILYDFLELYATKKENVYIYNKYAYKKAEYNKYIDTFCDKIKKCYFDSKKFYVTRTHSYKTIATILRQICRHNNIQFKSKIKYNKSKHEMEYYIGI
jgi:hypothetical protein